jgi:hypothetical protein
MYPPSKKEIVSPAYGFSALALVKCSNEGGPGPRHNMKEDPGTSTLIMKGEHGQEVPCDPGQVTSILGTRDTSYSRYVIAFFARCPVGEGTTEYTKLRFPEQGWRVH